MTLTPDKGKFQTPTKLDKNNLKKSTTPMKSKQFRLDIGSTQTS